MSKKTYQYRIEKKADGVFIIKERHTFMFFWRFWTTGSIKLKIPKQYATPQLAEEAIYRAAQQKGMRVFVLNIEGAKEAIDGAFKKARKKKRKEERKREEIAQNLKRIDEDPDDKKIAEIYDHISKPPVGMKKPKKKAAAPKATGKATSKKATPKKTTKSKPRKKAE
jgi:hypothetical protein